MNGQLSAQLFPHRGADRAQAQPRGRVRRKAPTVVLHREGVAQPARPEGDGHRAALPVPEGVLEGIGDQLVDHQRRRRGRIRAQGRMVAPDLDGDRLASGDKGVQVVLEGLQQLETVDGPVRRHPAGTAGRNRAWRN